MPETDDYIWTGKPTEQQSTDYMIWRFYEVQRKICDLWDISHTTILKFTTHRQMLEYEPGQLPKMTVLDCTDPEQMPPLLTPSCDPMKLLAIASCGLALTVPAFARIGETLEQAKQRCGEIQREEEFKGHRRIDFERNGFHVMTIFFGDRIGLIHYVKLPTVQHGGSEEMSEVEIKNFLKFNGGGKQWKQVAEGTWTVPGLTAHYFFDDVSRPAGVWALVIYTDEAQDEMAAYEAAEQTRNQEGF